MWSIIRISITCDFSYVIFSLYDEFMYATWYNFEIKINKKITFFIIIFKFT